MLLSDYTQREFSINVKFEGEVNDSFYEKIEKSLKMEKIQLEDDNENVNFGYFGRAIGNDDFLIPFTTKCKSLEDTINEENAIEMIKKKVKLFLPSSNYQKEIEIIANNFETKSEELINLANNKEFYDPIESIIKSNKLKLSSEDFLLNFVLKLCSINREYENLFEYVWIECCTIPEINKFIQYVNDNICLTRNMLSVISCMSRKLLKGIKKSFLKDNKYKNRYITIKKEEEEEEFLYMTEEDDEEDEDENVEFKTQN